ncbi:hypothetical protein HU200_014323 [Digitaria exilis]|uniref:Uncharacterized protein n=1 Tax=Digitaria exilis TaxID=1010633 RepID=A0A835A688_9POAL|nr:hypothetical protein HU200_062833 [Digitaria exilis]KAF8736552.1 hypothetical protein HU200_014323 [Digitaria exilis]
MAEGERSDPQPPAQAGGGGFSWPTALGFSFLTFNSGMAVYRSYNDKATVAFVVSSYVILVALFFCIKLFERAPPGSTTKGKLKVAVWGLTTVLTLLFSYKVAATMPVLVQVVVWLMAFATVSGGFYAFFVHSKEGRIVCWLPYGGRQAEEALARIQGKLHGPEHAWIMEANGTEVGGAILEEDGSYVLRFLEVPGPAQV